MNIALGGHNGIDTSHFAKMQCEKYKSFASVVLILKMLLRQMDLDKPFTGGIGSYKLYVLVAYHLQRHIQLGGQDRPSEVLLTFLYRFGNKKESEYTTPLSRELVIPIHTPSTKVKTLENAEGFADLSSIFKIDTCVALFQKSYDKLQKQVGLVGAAAKKKPVESFSLLSCVVDVDVLKYHRTSLKNSASYVYGFMKHRETRPICFNHSVVYGNQKRNGNNRIRRNHTRFSDSVVSESNDQSS